LASLFVRNSQKNGCVEKRSKKWNCGKIYSYLTAYRIKIIEIMDRKWGNARLSKLNCIQN
jgi:hypothetical protein